MFQFKMNITGYEGNYYSGEYVEGLNTNNISDIKSSVIDHTLF